MIRDGFEPVTPIFFAEWYGFSWDFSVGRDYRGTLAWDRIIVGFSGADKIR